MADEETQETQKVYEGGRLLVLNDYGVIQPGLNDWLVPGESYDLRAWVPVKAVSFRLTPSADGRSWRCSPTLPKLLAQLDLPVPDHLSNEEQAVLLVFPAPVPPPQK